MKNLTLTFFFLISLLTQAQSYQWAKGFGSTGYDDGYSIVVDGLGNSYVAGYFEGTVDFDPGVGTATLTSAGSYDIFFAKYDNNGNYLWANRIGGAGFDLAFALTVDGIGNVYVTGNFQNTADFDPGIGTANLVSAGSYDMFFAKYNSNGNYIWAKKIGATSGDYGYNITVDASGNVYVTGNFQSTVDFDPGTATANLTSSGNYDIFFAKYDNNGNYIWAKKIGSTGADYGYGIAVDGTGNVFITGNFQNTADFDPGATTINLTSAGGNDIYFGKYDSNGNYLWANRIGNTGDDRGANVVLDASGNAHITGYFESAADFDPGTGTANLTSAGIADIYFAKYDSNGNYIWANRIGSTGDDKSSGIVLDGAGNIHLTGWFQNTVDFDPGASTANLTFAGSYDIFFGKYDLNGNYIWANNIGSNASDYGRSIAVDGLGNVYITGNFQSTADFDSGTGTNNLISAGFTDFFITKYGSIGVGLASFYNKNDEFSIFPNPFNIETTLKINSNLNDATLTIYNSLGKEMEKINHISGDRVKLFRGDLPDGVYIVHIVQDNKLISNKKIIIID